MEALSEILTLAFCVALVVLIVFGIKWYKRRKDKEALENKQYKKKFWITLAICAGLFVCAGIISGSVDDQEAEAQTEQESKDNKESYKETKKDFIKTYKALGYATEEISDKEGKAWEEAIDNSGDDFDVSATLDKIVEDNTDDIDTVEGGLEKLHKLDQKIQKNDDVDDSDKKTIHNAYLDMKHFADHATNPSGSYNDFTDEHNELDRKVSDNIEELDDME